jgi:DNA-binding LacI/PurR family transcriptional regulator
MGDAMGSKGKCKYQRLADALEFEIYDSFQPGDTFTSQEILAERHSCNRATVKKAILELAARGFLEPMGKKGTRVADFLNAGFNPRLAAVVMPIRSHLWDKLHSELSCVLSENKYFTLSLDTSAAAEKLPGAEDEMFKRVRELLSFRPRNLIVFTEMDATTFLEKLGDDRRSFRNLIWLRDSGIPSSGTSNIGQVGVDSKATWRLLAESALRSGYKDIALFVQNISFLSEGLKRSTEEVLRENGFSERKVKCFNVEDLANSLDSLVKLARNSGSLAVICTYDYGAHLATGALKAANIAVPDQAGVYGVNNTPWAESDNLTSVGYDQQEWAGKIIDCIRRLDAGEERVELPIAPRLIQRSTTKAPNISSKFLPA